jgi:hypothetical protein
MDPRQIQQEFTSLKALCRALLKKNQRLEHAVMALQSVPRSIEDELNAIHGRRIDSALVGVSSEPFDITSEGQRGAPILFSVSQDGPFIWTHFPMALWLPVAPSTADNLGRWSPVSTFPVAAQEFGAGDVIDISYEITDDGPGRKFDNLPRPPLLSRPDNLMPLAVPTLLPPNTNLQFIPTFRRIFFDTTPTVDTTAGEIHVYLPGYRIVNL